MQTHSEFMKVRMSANNSSGVERCICPAECSVSMEGRTFGNGDLHPDVSHSVREFLNLGLPSPWGH